MTPRAGKTRALVRAAVEAGLLPADLDFGAIKAGRPSIVRRVPGWVGRIGVLEGEDEILLRADPKPEPGETFPAQLVLDVPAGRYIVEICDPAAASWTSRESAEGGPLVAGLPFTGHPLLVRVRPFRG